LISFRMFNPITLSSRPHVLFRLVIWLSSKAILSFCQLVILLFLILIMPLRQPFCAISLNLLGIQQLLLLNMLRFNCLALWFCVAVLLDFTLCENSVDNDWHLMTAILLSCWSSHASMERHAFCNDMRFGVPHCRCWFMG